MLSDLLHPIDNYCERLEPGLLAEPLNAATNLSFLIAAWLLFLRHRQGGRKDGEALALTALVAVVGVGSLLFHLFANVITMLGDVIPIAAFVLTYIWVSFRRLLGWRWESALAAMCAFLFVAPMMDFMPPEYMFNGSVAYFPCLAVLLMLWAGLRQKRHPQSQRLGLAALVFVCSLTFRSVDMALCEGFTIGTHFLWHGLNGVLLYLLVRAVMRQ